MRVAVVTEELAPWTRGGIGQLLACLVGDAIERDKEVAITVVTPSAGTLDATQLARTWGQRVQLQSCDQPGACPSPDHSKSLGIMRTLARLDREGPPFDVIEFADFRGWAFATLEEKRFRRSFASARIGVRVHGPASLIDWHERAPVDPCVFELERLALLHADQVVAHLDTIPDALATFFGFDEAWRARVRVEFPPTAPLFRLAPVRRPIRDLVFPTKVQTIKRPDLFVLAAARLMRRRPDWSGRAILAAARPSEEAARSLDALIPSDLAHRFLRHAGTQHERLELFAGNVVVVPSDFEALSLVAWEAAQQGATLVLSSRCPAFSSRTPLGLSEGTVHFDGTVESLARAMERALSVVATPRRAPPAATPWWFDDSTQRAATIPLAQRPVVSVLVMDTGNHAALEATLTSLRASNVSPLETLIGHHASATPPRAADERSRVIEVDLPREAPEGTAWCELACAARGELVMALRAGDRVDPAWMEQATAALESPGIEAVTPSVDGVPLLGGATVAGLGAPVVAAPGCVWRRRTWAIAREDAPSLESLCWALGLACALTGRALLASQELGLRTGSPLKVDLEWVRRGLPVPLPGVVHPLVLTAAGPSPLRHRVADVLAAKARTALPGAHHLVSRLAGRLLRNVRSRP